jgi:hypothetical protein
MVRIMAFLNAGSKYPDKINAEKESTAKELQKIRNK